MSTSMEVEVEVAEVWDFGDDDNNTGSADCAVKTTNGLPDKTSTNGAMAKTWSDGTRHKTAAEDNASSDSKPTREDIGSGDSTTHPFKELYVFDRNRDKRSGDEVLEALNGFESHHKLGSFRIEDNHSYNDVNCEQNVVVSDEELKTIEKMAVNLMDGFDTSSLITDYKTYKELKWKYFLKWIRRSRCLTDRSSESLPHFVCFGGLFTSLLMTPSLVEDWTLVVTRFKDTIFMNKVRLNEDWKRGRRQPQPAVDSNPSVGDGSKGFVDKNTYFAAKVTQIVTNGDKEANSRAVNEFEKCFNCYESQIGDHRLLLMSEMDAIDEEGNQYEIKCSKSMAFGQKLLQWWANCVVADIDRIIVGLKDSEDVLKEIQTVDVSEIPSMSSFRWNTDESFGFVNRCLNFIQEVLKDSKDLDTFRVVFRKRFKNIRVYHQSTHGLLPNWFTAEEEWDEWDHQFDTQTTRLYSHK